MLIFTCGDLRKDAMNVITPISHFYLFIPMSFMCVELFGYKAERHN